MNSVLPNNLNISMLIGAGAMIVLTWLVFSNAAKKAIPSKFQAYLWSVGIALALILWYIGAFLLARTEFFRELYYFIPNVGLLFVPIIAGLTLWRNSETFRQIVYEIPWHQLMFIQVTRLMGYTFLVLYAMKLMPGEFAIPSGIGDVIVGASAPIVAYIYWRKISSSRKFAIGWNIFGALELVNAIVLGFFSFSTPYQQFSFDLPNDILFSFPLALVPVFAVPLSILLHIFALKILFKKN